jgi:hypothetical protein
MITDEAIAAFNARLVDLGKIEKFGPHQREKVKTAGAKANALLTNPDFAMFVYQYKFQLCDELDTIKGYSDSENNHRLAISYQIAGIQRFVDSLHSAVYYGNRAGKLEQEVQPPLDF